MAATLTFEWDQKKAEANLKSHGVNFEDAATVFRDPLAVVHGDPDHSNEEARCLLIGHSTERHLLLVAFTDRESKIRIISARRATRRERRRYEEEKPKPTRL